MNDFISWHLRGCLIKGVEVIFKALDFFKATEKATRQALARRLSRVAYADVQDAHTTKVLARRGLPCDLFTVDCIHDHYAILPPGLDKFRKNQFLLTFNALATGKRRMVVSFPDNDLRHAQPLPPCPFCHRVGSGGEGGDDVDHFFSGRCPVIVEARQRFSALIDVDLSPLGLLSHHDHADCEPPTPSPPPPEGEVAAVGVVVSPSADLEYDRATCGGLISPTVRVCQEAACRNFGSEERTFKIISYLAFGTVSQATTTALMAFSSTVWTERCIFFITRTQADEEADFNPAIRLASAAALAYSGATTSVPKGFGKAGTRTAKQTALAKAYAEGRVAAIPVGDAMAYTDGASRGNPGDAGSGTSLSINPYRAISVI